MNLRPHHLLDIISGLGRGAHYTPHPYGHSQHLVVAQLLADPAQEITFVCAADAICAGCVHLQPDGSCNDVLAQLDPAPSKQAYNDALDMRLFPLLGLRPGDTLPLPEYLAHVKALLPGLEQVCTHPGEDQAVRLASMQIGVEVLSPLG
ncbi:MAG: hypothetical protein ACYC6L_08520 [Anaerolineae bacterium]